LLNYQYYFLLFGLLGACVNADAATLFTALEVFGSLSSLAAADATAFDVCSFLAAFAIM
jgi:hypothetical protein